MSSTHSRWGPASWAGAAIIAYLLACTCLTACDRAGPGGRGPAGRIEGALLAIVATDAEHPCWAGICGGARRYATAIPSVRLVCATPRDNTSDSLSAAIRDVLDSGPRAVCLFVTDAHATKRAIDQIAAAQIPIVTMGMRCEDVRVAAQVRVDTAGAAELLGDNLERLAAGRRSYVLLHSRGRDDLATTCYQRFRAKADRQYQMTLLREEGLAAGERSATQAVEDLLGRFPNAGLVVTLEPEVWLTARAGWQRELCEQSPGLRFVTTSSAPALWKQLGSPAAPGVAAGLVGPVDGAIGFAAAELAAELVLGAEPGTRTRVITSEVVTPDNLADFAQRYSEAANNLDVSPFMPVAPTTSPADK